MKTPAAAHHVRVTPFGIAVEAVEIVAMDSLRRVALCRVARAGFFLKNEIPFSELASSPRKASAMVAALLMPARSAASAWPARRAAVREAATLRNLSRTTGAGSAGQSAARPVAGLVSA